MALDAGGAGQQVQGRQFKGDGRFFKGKRRLRLGLSAARGDRVAPHRLRHDRLAWLCCRNVGHRLRLHGPGCRLRGCIVRERLSGFETVHGFPILVELFRGQVFIVRGPDHVRDHRKRGGQRRGTRRRSAQLGRCRGLDRRKHRRCLRGLRGSHRGLGRQFPPATGVQQQRIGAASATLGQRALRIGRRRNHASGLLAATHGGSDLGLDTLGPRHLVITLHRFGLDQLRLRHRFGSTDQPRHPRQQAGLGLRRRFGNRLFLNQGLSIGGLFGKPGLFGGQPRRLAPFSPQRLTRPCRRDPGRCATTQQRHQAAVDNDRPHHRVTQAAPYLGPGEPQYKGRHRQHDHSHRQRGQLDHQMRPQRNQREQRPHHGVAKQTTQSETVRRAPGLARNKSGGIDRHDRDPDRHEDQPAHRPILARMQGKAQTPGDQHQRDAPGAATDNHEQRRSDRRANPPGPVLHRRIGRYHPVGVVGRIGAHHRRREQAQHDQRQTQQLFPAPLDGGLHVAVQKRIAIACVI